MEDQFGRDPQVRYLREVFARMEKRQTDLLLHLGVSPSDYRLRRIREAALKSFEKAWMAASRRDDVATSEEQIATLYIHCLSRVMAGNRISVPPAILPPDEKINAVLKEVFK
jgi:hypothetical protein